MTLNYTKYTYRERMRSMLFDIVFDEVDASTLWDAAAYSTVDPPEFILVLAGADTATVDYSELRKLAVEELIRYLKGEDDGNPDP